MSLEHELPQAISDQLRDGAAFRFRICNLRVVQSLIEFVYLLVGISLQDALASSVDTVSSIQPFILSNQRVMSDFRFRFGASESRLGFGGGLGFN